MYAKLISNRVLLSTMNQEVERHYDCFPPRKHRRSLGELQSRHTMTLRLMKLMRYPAHRLPARCIQSLVCGNVLEPAQTSGKRFWSGLQACSPDCPELSRESGAHKLDQLRPPLGYSLTILCYSLTWWLVTKTPTQVMF